MEDHVKRQIMAPRLNGQTLPSHSTKAVAGTHHMSRTRAAVSVQREEHAHSIDDDGGSRLGGDWGVRCARAGRRVRKIVLSASKDAKETQVTFAPDTAKIFLSADLTDAVASGSKLTVSWISVDSGGVAPANYKIDEVSFEIGKIENHVDSSMTKPDAGWPVGTYQVQIAVDGTMKEAVDFSVK